MVPALINGAPFFYFDTAGYLQAVDVAVGQLLPAASVAAPAADASSFPAATPDDGVVQAGRSIYYGALGWLGWKTTIWLPVMVQCLATAWLIVRLAAALVVRHWPLVSAAIFVLLALGTTSGLFAALVMPDVWAGLAILALALLWMPEISLHWFERLAIFAVLAFAALAHTSHIALLAAMVAGYAVLRLIAGARFPFRRGALAVPVLALLVGIGGQVAFSKAVEMFYGAPPLSFPHITAHLVDLGPGTRYAQASCPESGYALCAYADQLPVDWINFLFSRGENGVYAVADAETKRALVAEQSRFVIETLRYAPAETIGGLLFDGLKQFWTLDVGGVALTRNSQVFLETNFPPDLMALTQSSRLYDAPGWMAVATQMTQASTALATIALLALVATGSGGFATPDETQNRLRALLWAALAGIAANALICGILASPYGRFQARVVWILPMLPILVLAVRILHAPSAKRRSSEI